MLDLERIAAESAAYLAKHLTCKLHDIETFEGLNIPDLRTRMSGFHQLYVSTFIDDEEQLNQYFDPMRESLARIINEHALGVVTFGKLPPPFPQSGAQGATAIQDNVLVRCVAAFDGPSQRTICSLDVYVSGIDAEKIETPPPDRTFPSSDDV